MPFLINFIKWCNTFCKFFILAKNIEMRHLQMWGNSIC